MAYAENHSGGENLSMTNAALPALAALGKKNIDEIVKAQSELLSTMQDAHRRWFDRMQSEAKLASEFTRKVTNCRSIPDAVAACQEWTGRQLEMMADDGRHLLTDSRKVMERSARLLSDGLFAGGAEAEAAPGAVRTERARSAEPASMSDAAWK